MNAPVAILAGGTGGHVFPGLAVAEGLRAHGVPVVWLGGARGIEHTLVPAAGIELHRLPFSGVRGKGALSLLLAPWRLLRASTMALRLLRHVAPRSVISFGGFAAAPGGIAAWLLRRPLLVHEANRIPGSTNRLLARLAKRVLTGFPGTFPASMGEECTGNPVRSNIASLPAPGTRFEGRSGVSRLLVLGGSQGARSINSAMPSALAMHVSAAGHWQVRHQTGRDQRDAVSAAYAAAGVHAQVTEFIDDMAAAYAWADLAVCRAGALTLAELTAAGLGAILIPFPYAIDDHQTANASVLVGAGAAVIVSESTDLAADLSRTLAQIRASTGGALDMAQRARDLSRPDATSRIVALCMEDAA